MTAFESFAAESRAAGFEEVLERKWPPHKVLDTHTHPFSVRALVVQGDMWLTLGDSIQHLRPGERYGAEGATFWVARRYAGRP